MEINWIPGLFTAEVVLAIFAAELRNLRWATAALALQSLFLVVIICTFGYLSGISNFYWWASITFISRVLLIPWLLWKYMRKVPVSEVRPRIGLIPSVILMAFILPAAYQYFRTYLCSYYLEFLPRAYAAIGETAAMNLALGLMILVLGVYVLLAKRDIIKLMMGLVLMENGLQWAFVSAAPTVHEAAEIGLACDLVIASWILLYFSKAVYEICGTRDSPFISELKW
jgi:hydrogenase-4 component E